MRTDHSNFEFPRKTEFLPVFKQVCLAKHSGLERAPRCNWTALNRGKTEPRKDGGLTKQ